MKESCEVYQRRNRHNFGERTLVQQKEPPKVSSGSHGKSRENPTPFKNSNTLSNHLPPIHEQETRAMRSQNFSKMARVAPPRRIKQTVVIPHRPSQPRVSQFSNIQGQQRKSPQANMVTLPSVARQNDAEKNTKRREERAALKGHTIIYRPGLPHISQAVSGTKITIPHNKTNYARHLQRETMLAPHEPSESEQSIDKHQGAIKQKQKAEAHPPLAVPGTIPRKNTLKNGMTNRYLKPPKASGQQNPRENKQSINNHQSATKQQQKQRVTGNLINPTADISQEMQPQRWQGTRMLMQSSGRRKGLCKQTDPAQQHLTFIRVLRKRF